MEAPHRQLISSKKFGNGIYLCGSQGEEFEYCVRYTFSATNNVVKYEALLTGLEITKKVGARHVVVHVDSQLVAKHVMGIMFEVRSTLIVLHHMVSTIVAVDDSNW